MSTRLNKIYLVLAALLQVIDSLSKLDVRIPEFIQKGDTADMTCSYYLEDDELYSVKWYKGRHEFYRYMPHEFPHIKIFPVKGMKINTTASNHNRVVIEDVQINYSGTYQCEVTVAGSFFSLMQRANMTVIDFPSRGPTISSPRKQYQVGETAHLTCTAQPSSPPTHLAWYINGEPANEAYLRNSSHRHGVQRLDLSFPVTSNHFNNPKNSNSHVRLKCSAAISNYYWKSVEIKLLQERPKFASVKNVDPEGVAVAAAADGNLAVGAAEAPENLAASISSIKQLDVMSVFLVMTISIHFVINPAAIR